MASKLIMQNGYLLNTIFIPLLAGLLKMTSSNIQHADCDGYTFVDPGYRCYIVSNETTDYIRAKQKCETLGGHVVSITTEEEKALVIDLMTSHAIQFIWLGAQEISETWKWLDGREVFRQGCFKENQTSRELFETQLLANNGYNVCESQCSEKSYSYGGIMARDRCSCGNSFGRYGYSDQCHTTCPDNPDQTCGGTKENDVFAVDGTYSNWGNDQPNNHLKYQTCAEIETQTNFLWNDARCTEVRGFVCEIDNRTICMDNNSLTIESPVTNKTSCYYISTERLTWFEARQSCSMLGGDLLIIDDPDIDRVLLDQFLTMNISGDNFLSGFWFGLTRSPWKWQSGEDFIFTSWRSDEPNGNGQHCVTMSQSGGWEDIACSDLLTTVCEIDTTLPTTTEPTTAQSTTPKMTTTTPLELAPVRKHPRPSTFKIDDRHLAAIVAGGVGMLVIIIVALAIHCHLECKKRAKRKEEKKDAKREKYFFGFDSSTAENHAKKGNVDNNNTDESDENIGQENQGYKETDTEAQLDEETGVATSKRDSGTSQTKEGRLSGLSEKPDLIPESDN